MLQIGIHYTDVLEYLVGPVKAVSAHVAQLVLPGENPDVASMVLEHENGALSTVNASYASAGEYYLMNVYGKEATAHGDFNQGLRPQKRGARTQTRCPVRRTTRSWRKLEEFAAAVRGAGAPEMDGERGTASWRCCLRGIKSAQEGRRVTVAEVLKV
jgi:predicted dehydrogenase